MSGSNDDRLLVGYIIAGVLIILMICFIFIALVASILHACLRIKVRKLQMKLSQLQLSIDSKSYKHHGDATDNNYYEMMTIDQKDNSSGATNPDSNLTLSTITASIICLRIKTRRLQTKLNQLQLNINSIKSFNDHCNEVADNTAYEVAIVRDGANGTTVEIPTPPTHEVTINMEPMIDDVPKKSSNIAVCPNTTSSSDETVVNPGYAAITDATASSNETLELQRNPAYVARRNIISETDATCITRSDETSKLQRNPAYVTISDASRVEMIELQRNPAYAMNTTSTAVNDQNTTCIASRDETIKLQQNPAYVAITDDISDNRVQTIKLQRNPAYAVINTSTAVSNKTGSTNEPMKVQRNSVHAAISESITTNSDETIVNSAYAPISGNASSDETRKLQESSVHGPVTENTNSDETLVNPLYTWVDDKHSTAICSDETVEIQQNAVHTAVSENTTTNSDETIVNPVYAPIIGKDSAASSDETTRLQSNPVHGTIIRKNTNSDETIVNPLYSRVDDKTASCSDKTVIQRNLAYATAVVPPGVHLYEEIPDSRTVITNINRS